MPWTWSSSFFVTIFTRKGPELCKIKDREGRPGHWEALQDSQVEDIMPQLAPSAGFNYLQIFSLTERTIEISQIFSDKNHPNLENRQRSTSNGSQHLCVKRLLRYKISRA